MPDLPDDYLSGRETVPAVVADALQDSAYVAGLKAGWNAGVTNDEARYAMLCATRSDRLSALAEYKRRLKATHHG